MAERAENFRTSCQRCLLGWTNTTRTGELAKTAVRMVRRLEIVNFSEQPKMPLTSALRSEMERWTSRWVVEGPFYDISTGQSGQTTFSLRPHDVRTPTRRKSSDQPQSAVTEYFDLWSSRNTRTTVGQGFSEVKWVS